jgi:hypothetical protein
MESGTEICRISFEPLHQSTIFASGKDAEKSQNGHGCFILTLVSRKFTIIYVIRNLISFCRPRAVPAMSRPTEA